MSYNNKFNQSRSHFYLQSFENEDSFSINASKFTRNLIHRCQKEIEGLSPTGWKKSKKFDDLYNLWIPNNRIDYCVLDNFFEWAEVCHSCVWVKLNKNTKDYFDEDSLDFCICSDWNFNFDGKSGRTVIGEVEYNFKYCGKISEDDIKLIEHYLNKCLFCISGYDDNILVTTIPAITEKQNKPSWELAHCIATALDTDFLTITLLNDKPQMKSLDVSEKIKIWRGIYADNRQIDMSVDSDEIDGKTVIIVDDLYQSGASMWCYAEYLKSMGALNVLGISLVKSLKDSDNKSHS